MTTRRAPVTGPPYAWDRAAARWRDRRTGRYVPALAPRQALEGVIAATQTQMLGLSGRLQRQEISLAQWQGGMAALSKRLHLAAALGAAGTDVLTPAGHGRVGAILRGEYAGLDAFAADIYSGKQPIDGRLLNRTRQYAQAGRATWEAIRGAAEVGAGYTLERRRREARDSCAGCIRWADGKWRPAGETPPIGSQDCWKFCLCTMERKRPPKEAA